MALYTKLFIIILLLAFNTAGAITTDEIFDHYIDRLNNSELNIIPSQLLLSVLKTDINKYRDTKKLGIDIKLKSKRNQLVKLLLTQTADKNKFLATIVSQKLYLDNSKQRLIKIPYPEELILLALSCGAKLHDAKINHFYLPPSLQTLEIILKNNYDPNKLLRLLLEHHIYHLCSTKQKQLVLLTLRYGADPNKLLEQGYYPTRLSSLGIYISPEILDLLFTNKYKKLNPTLFYRHLKARGRDYFTVNRLDKLLKNPALAHEIKFKNLHVKKSQQQKIPRLIHGVWLTNEKQKREIPLEEIANILKTHQMFFQDNRQWQYVLWINDSNLLAKSISLLKSRGIRIENIASLKKDYPMLSKVLPDLINEGKWGIAGDIIRSCVIHKWGGVYADLDYIFLRNLEEEIYKYDFITTDYGDIFIDTFLFAAKPNHPILDTHLKLLERNFFNPPSYLTLITRDSPIFTSYVSVTVFSIAYYQAANRDGNIDVAYPYLADSTEVFRYAPLYTSNNGDVALQKLIDVIEKNVPQSKTEVEFLKQERALYAYMIKNKLNTVSWWRPIGEHICKKAWMNKEEQELDFYKK